jgi:hypothetical protein
MRQHAIVNAVRLAGASNADNPNAAVCAELRICPAEGMLT